MNSQTSVKKNVRELTNIQNADSQQSWLSDLGEAVTAAVKAGPKLQAEKWEAKVQLQQSAKVLQALVTVRKTYQAHMTKTKGELEETLFSSANKPILKLGTCTPNWMQLLAKDALT